MIDVVAEIHQDVNERAAAFEFASAPFEIGRELLQVGPPRLLAQER